MTNVRLKQSQQLLSSGGFISFVTDIMQIYNEESICSSSTHSLTFDLCCSLNYMNELKKMHATTSIKLLKGQLATTLLITLGFKSDFHIFVIACIRGVWLELTSKH